MGPHSGALLLLLVFSGFVEGLPSLRDSIRQPSHVYEGEDALLTCVVRNLESNTLLWKREEPDKRTTRILTAGESRVTSDKRFNILHDSGGDVWVLVVKNVRPSDSGIYICEINSNPILRSFHSLDVLPININHESAVENNTKPSDIVAELNHNYTACCKQEGVSETCLGFCSLKNIMDGTTEADPDKCETDFPSIVKCMADGRDHVPCCKEEGVPDICQDICRGEYTIPNDDIKTHVSCSAYTEQTLACIAQGIEILPSSPEAVFVESTSESSLVVSWNTDVKNLNTVTYFVVHVASLANFDALDNQEKKSFTSTVKVLPDQNSTTIENLSPFTMYEIYITCENSHGQSLPSIKVRTLTNSAWKNFTPGHSAPILPDIKECCNRKGIYHNRCLDKFCDPVRTADVSLPDLMICAPWASDSFSCLANGIDHTSCCKSRGLPNSCVQLCTGNITRVDFNQFRCIQYMDELSNCLLQGYGVLPGSPIAFRITLIDETFVILNWDVPKTLGKTVTSYNIHYRETSESSNGDYKIVNTKRVPFILENLKMESDYEVYVSAVNEHGVGEPSPRILFKTTNEAIDISSDNSYNVTACCRSVNLDSHCMPLCDYSAKLSDLKSLATTCSKEFPKLLRCGAGGRNHIGCCERRGIPEACLNFCTGSVTEELLTTSAACVPYIGNVIQCFEEGTGVIPGPVIQLRATEVTNTSVTLAWQRPEEGDILHYIVHYMKVEQSFSKTIAFELDEQITVNETVISIKGLPANTMYSFFVLAANEHGTSLPSSILTVNISTEALTNGPVSGVPSAPLQISVTSRSADYITVTWQHPLLMHPTDLLRYRFYYRMKNESIFKMEETNSLSFRLTNLTANTQHIIYITALNSYGESRPSETLIAWTDPAFAPLVELPTIHPINIILEGGSMTILCVAMGTPMPTVSLYVSGNLIRQEKTRHLVTVLSNVTRSMNVITCFAENGYGEPSQASKRIIIGRRPNITTSIITMASLGDDVTVECEVDAHPSPIMFFSRNPEGLEKILNGSKAQTAILRGNKEVDSSYIMQLKIRNMESSDSGVYYCFAQNSFGSISQAIKLQARQKLITSILNVTSCCAEQNVTNRCMDACTSFLDIDSVIDRPECIGDFHKLMRCAADGSDHRVCCSQWGVPRRCLDWCRGETVENSDLCALSYTKQIVSCFHEGQEKIPGPPKNIQIELSRDNSVAVNWDPPSKNPEKVELYRVFWRPQGSKQAFKNDTRLSSLYIDGLKEGIPYELVVKAGNHYGTSTFTDPVIFTLNDKYIISASTKGNNDLGVIVGVVFAVLIIGSIILAVIFYFRKSSLKISGNVSFENPYFLRRNTPASDTMQIVANETIPEASVGIECSPCTTQPEIQNSSKLRDEGLGIDEELSLGPKGVGFRRFK